MKTRLTVAGTALILVIAALASPGAAFAYANSVTYTGQGLIADGLGGWDLQSEICGKENGAEVDGPYILWVLTATRATAADITGPWGTVNMTKTANGAFKYVSGWYDPAQLLEDGVTATYNGLPRNVQLVISHGCRPFTSNGAWCSPGFWRNALPGAWTLVGHSPSELFNTTVNDFWYSGTFAADPTLDTVLHNPQTYSGPSSQGTGVACAMNAFNATGAYLTNGLPGYEFDCEALLGDESNTCPIDHHGNWK